MISKQTKRMKCMDGRWNGFDNGYPREYASVLSHLIVDCTYDLTNFKNEHTQFLHFERMFCMLLPIFITSAMSNSIFKSRTFHKCIGINI